MRKCACVRASGEVSVYTPVAFSELRLTRCQLKKKKKTLKMAVRTLCVFDGLDVLCEVTASGFPVLELTSERKFPLVSMSASWFSVSTYLIRILGSKLLLSNNQSRATL